MPIGINLLPWRTQQQQRERRLHRRRLLVAMLGGFSLSVLAWLPLNAQHDHQQQANQDLEAQAAALAEARATQQQLSQTTAQLSRYHDQQKALAAAQDAWLAAFTGLVQADNEHTRLERIAQIAEHWRIAGRITDAASLPAVLQRLQSHARFTDVEVEYVEPPSQAKDHTVRFAIAQTARMP